MRDVKHLFDKKLLTKNHLNISYHKLNRLRYNVDLQSQRYNFMLAGVYQTLMFDPPYTYKFAIHPSIMAHSKINRICVCTARYQDRRFRLYHIPGSFVPINTYSSNVGSRNPISSNTEKENGNHNHNVRKYITYQLPR